MTLDSKTNELTIQTDDPSYVGTHDLLVKASLNGVEFQDQTFKITVEKATNFAPVWEDEIRDQKVQVGETLTVFSLASLTQILLIRTPFRFSHSTSSWSLSLPASASSSVLQRTIRLVTMESRYGLRTMIARRLDKNATVS